MNRKWNILKSAYLLVTPWLTVRKDYVRQPNGGEIDDYYVLEYPDWVTVIAITENGEFVMERQYRHGIQKTCFELCGGTIEKDEDPLQAARRELLEETGYTGGEWTIFAPTAPNPAAMSNICHTFIAKGVQKVSSQCLEATEDIEVILLTRKELLQAMMDGEVLQGDMLAPLWRYMFETK